MTAAAANSTTTGTLPANTTLRVLGESIVTITRDGAFVASQSTARDNFVGPYPVDSSYSVVAGDAAIDISLKDDSGTGEALVPAMLTTDDNGNTVLVGPDGTEVPLSSFTTVWAARPNAATHLGALIYVTDVGINGSIWISNGTVWRPTAPVVLFSDLDVFTAATSATEQIAVQINIPAGMMADGSNLRVMFAGEKSGTTDATSASFRLRMGTAGTTSDVVVAGGVSIAQSNLSLGVQSLIGRSSSSTEVQKLGAGGAGVLASWNSNNSSAPAPKVTVGNLDTENNILSLTVQPGGTVDVVSVTSLLVELV